MATFTCPKCGMFRTGVLDTRHNQQATRRRRLCVTCGTRFTTYELYLPKNMKKHLNRLSDLLENMRKAQTDLQEIHMLLDIVKPVSKRLRNTKGIKTV